MAHGFPPRPRQYAGQPAGPWVKNPNWPFSGFWAPLEHTAAVANRNMVQGLIDSPLYDQYAGVTYTTSPRRPLV